MPPRVRLVHARATEWPGGFPHGVVTRTPTVDEVMEVARKYEIFGTNPREDKASTKLFHMLNGGHSRNGSTLDRYTHTRDPYEYREYCRLWDLSHTKSKGGWPNTARLLIFWMAEEMRTMGHGNGCVAHFTRTVTDESNSLEHDITHVDVVTEQEAMAQEDAEWGEALVAHYHMEVMESVSPQAPATRTERVSTFPSPPSQNAQRARTLGHNQELIEFLRNNGSFKKVRRSDNGYLRYCNANFIKGVKLYLRTPEGIHFLESCEIDSEAYTIDHVWPQCHGGPDHLWNLHLMPLRHNSRFKDVPFTHPDKQAYVGVGQVNLVLHLMRTGGKRLDWEKILYDSD